jgi:hypothetical protein
MSKKSKTVARNNARQSIKRAESHSDGTAALSTVAGEGWPIKKRDADFEESLRNRCPTEVGLLTNAGRTALCVYLRSVHAHEVWAVNCAQRSIPREIREMFRALRSRLQGLSSKLADVARHPKLYDEFLATDMAIFAQDSTRLYNRIGYALSPSDLGSAHVKQFLVRYGGQSRSKPRVRMGPKQYQIQFWPFFRPALFYCVARIYELHGTTKRKQTAVFSDVHKLLGPRMQSASAALRQTQRFKSRFPDRANVIDKLIASCISDK